MSGDIFKYVRPESLLPIWCNPSSDKMDCSESISNQDQEEEASGKCSDDSAYEERDDSGEDEVASETPTRLLSRRPRRRTFSQKGTKSAPVLVAFLRALDLKRHSRIRVWNEDQGQIVIDVLNIVGFFDEMDRFLRSDRRVAASETRLESRLKALATWFVGFPRFWKMREIFSDSRDQVYSCQLCVSNPIRKYRTSQQLGYAVMDMAELCHLQLCAAST
jgi:hypothetical protein